MKNILFLTALIFPANFLFADNSNFTKVELPHGFTIEVPSNWMIVSDSVNKTLATAGEAAVNMSGVEVPKGKSEIVFSARSLPEDTYATLSVTISDAKYNNEDMGLATSDELKALTPIYKDRLEKVLTVGGSKVEGFTELKVIKHAGDRNALFYNYQRSSDNGSVFVVSTTMVSHNKEIVFIISYRQKEFVIWEPIAGFMWKSIKYKAPVLK